MTVEQNHDAYEQGETPSWAWPVHAFVAWLATILDYIARFKRARRFKPNWRDNWEGLRECEWHRDQLIAQGVAQLLAGKPLQLDDTKIQLSPPATYGGPCPRTPFDMSRRFIALARWAADPEAIIRARFKRLSRIIHACPASSDAARCAAAQHELACRAVAQRRRVGVADRMERPSTWRAHAQRRRKHERGLTTARGPPQTLFPIANSLLPRRRQQARSPPHAQH